MMVKILIFLVIFLSNFSLDKSQNLIMEKDLHKIWILNADNVKSPWNNIIVPIFIDLSYEESEVLLRGYGLNSQNKYKYQLLDDNILLETGINFQIKYLTNNTLILIINNKEFFYSSLIPSDNKNISSQIVKVLYNNKKWILDDRLLEFTLEKENFNENLLLVKEHKNNELYYGSYYIDYYRGNHFILFLIDGQYREEMYQIIDFSAESMTLVKINIENTPTLLMLVK